MNKLLQECMIGKGHVQDFKTVSFENRQHATFHMWTLTVLGNQPITVGVVETLSGKCLYVPKENIEFIENTSFITGQRSIKI